MVTRSCVPSTLPQENIQARFFVVLCIMKEVTIGELKAVPAFNDLPNEQLQWILDRGEYHEYEDGSQIKKTGDEADVMFIIIEGSVTFYMDIHGRLVYYY